MNFPSCNKDEIEKIIISHVVWRNLFGRCYNENNNDFKNYGGRGILVCDSWHGDDGFWNFINDIGLRPSKKYSLDRIDVNKGYTKENVRWADAKTQAQNKRNGIFVSFNGKTINLAKLARNYGVRYQSLWKLVVVKKIPPEKSIEILLKPKQQTISDLARLHGIKPATLMRRIRTGVPLDIAVSAPLRAGVKTYKANHGC
jgi:hypothetical protein